MKLKTVISGVLILVIGYVIFSYLNKPKYAVFGEDNFHEISVGEKFSFLLNENRSTGYEYCWLNKDECTILERTSNSYSIHNPSTDGGGGTTQWTIKGIKKGLATIKICKCPTMVQEKNCSDYKLEECSSPLMIKVSIK